MTKHGLPPTIYQNFYHIIGRALRETGQSLHRLGVKTTSLAITKHDYYDDPCIYEDHLSRHRQLFPMPISGRPIIHRNIAFIAPCATLIGSVYVGQYSSIWYGAVLRGDTCENTASLTTRYKIEEGVHDNDDNMIGKLGSSSSSPSQQSSQQQLLSEAVAPAAPRNPEEKVSAIIPTAAAASSTTNTDISKLENVPKPWSLSVTRHQDQLDSYGGGIFIGDNTNIQDAVIITSYQNHCMIGNNVTIGHSAQLHSCTVHDNVLIGMGSIVHEGAIIEPYSFIAAGAVIPKNTIVPTGTLWMGNPARYVRDVTPEGRNKILYQSTEYVQVALTHQHVMELGGNVDPETGVSVYITSDDDDDNDTDDIGKEQLEQPGSSGTSTVDGHINGANNTAAEPPVESSLTQDEDRDNIQVVGNTSR